jgi:hypothetical protein
MLRISERFYITHDFGIIFKTQYFWTRKGMNFGLRWENLQETNFLEDFDVELNVSLIRDLKKVPSET